MSLIQVNNIYKSFAGVTLFKNVNFNVNEKDKIGLIGINGAGKSTLIKLLLGLEEPDNNPETRILGTISKSSNVQIGYLSQHSDLNPQNNILEELLDTFGTLRSNYERIQELNKQLQEDTSNEKLINELTNLISIYEEQGGYTSEYKIQKVLNDLEVSENLWNNKINTLSGGQQTKISLCKILLKDPDFLILDEPTNHLDIYSREVLEQAFDNYTGTILAVSHDRQFLNNIIDKLCIIDQQKTIYFDGTYDEYAEQRVSKVSKTSSQNKKVLSVDEDKQIKLKISQLQKENMNFERTLKKLDLEEKKLAKEFELAGKENYINKLTEIQLKIDKINEEMMKLLESIDINEKEILSLTN